MKQVAVCESRYIYAVLRSCRFLHIIVKHWLITGKNVLKNKEKMFFPRNRFQRQSLSSPRCGHTGAFESPNYQLFT